MSVRQMVLPGFWMNETSGVLRSAVEAFLLQDGPLTVGQIVAVRAYLRQWMAAEWCGGEVEVLRSSLEGIASRTDLSAWYHRALDANIDPF